MKKAYALMYRPEPELVDWFEPFATNVREHTWGNGDVELMFELPSSLYGIEKESEEFDRNEIEELLHTEYTDTVISCFTDAEASEWIDLSEHSITDFFTVHDLFSEEFTDIADVIARESPGGDIRKYANTLYGGCPYSFDIGTMRSSKMQITGFDPFSMKSIEEMLEMGYLESGMFRDTEIRYPSAERVLEWSRRVDDRWGLDCAGIGAIHCQWGYDSSEVQAGLDGFVIYDADEEVKKWADAKWGIDNPQFPFMRPDEFDLRMVENVDYVDRSRIRMWWD